MNIPEQQAEQQTWWWWWPFARWLLAFVLASYLGVNGLGKKSLNKSGALAGFAVGLVSLGLSLRLGLTLILFYKSGSILTKVGFDKKAKLTDEYKEGGQRDATQVLSCSLFAVLLAVAHLAVVGVGDTLVDFRATPPAASAGATLLCAYLGFYACCAGDTWSSELGVLAKRPPRLVTRPWRTVPPGTNGGVSLEGTLSSVAAGLFMGAGFVVFGWIFRLSPPPPSPGASSPSSSPPSQVGLIFLGALIGLLGSLMDSLMGAVLQASYFDRNRKVIVEKPTASMLSKGEVELICGHDILSNVQVNAASAVLSSLLAGLLGRWLFSR